MKLTAVQIKNAQPQGKLYRLQDGNGLCLVVHPTGRKTWQFRFKINGKADTFTLGKYPAISLKEAREEHLKAQGLVTRKINPKESQRAEQAEDLARAETFSAVAKEWHEKWGGSVSPGHAARIWRGLEVDVIPWIGPRPIAEIEPPDLLQVLRRIESRGALETAHRVLANCGQVFRYAVATGRTTRNPAQDLKGALPFVSRKHHDSITDPKEIGPLLRAIENYQGTFTVKCALRLAPYVMLRPGEIRFGEWAEIDFDESTWRIPAVRMKRKTQPHIVPLSKQAQSILEELHPYTGNGKYIFPGTRQRAKTISENTMRAALIELGYKGRMSAHGFRSMASTCLNELGWPGDAIERQLHHVDGNSVRASYNYAEHLPERRRMLQAWADYLDSLRDGGKIVPLHRPSANE